MVYRITNATSVSTGGGHAFSASGPDTLIVDPNAFLRTYDAAFGAFDAARLLGPGAWTVTVRGTLDSQIAYGLNLVSAAAITSSVTVTATGGIFGGAGGIFSDHALNLNNSGQIAVDRLASFGTAVTVDANADYTITNSGEIIGASPALTGIGIALSGAGTHTINNSGLISGLIGIRNESPGNGIENVTNSGTIEGFVVLGNGHDTLVNSGVIESNVSMGSGNDTVTIEATGTVLGFIGLDDGNDTLNGSDGIEQVFDGTGNDKYTLLGGDDIYKVLFVSATLDKADAVNGGAGYDTFDASQITTAMLINLDTVGHAGIGKTSAFLDPNQRDQLVSFERVIAGSGNDTIYGSAAANEIFGGDGGDYINGLAGNDRLHGGANVGITFDTLVGGAGRDHLWGEGGPDVFVFEATTDSGVTVATRDVIWDFDAASGDVIDLAGIDADSTNGPAPNDAFDYIGFFGQFTATAGELRTLYQGANTIIEGDVDGDAIADFTIALSGRVSISEGNFIL